MTETKHLKAALTLRDDAEAGLVQAVFSVFNVADSDGDVVLPSFFTEGQTIPMAAWGHAWGSLPPGKGVVHITPEHAVFDGQFFMDTDHGLQHFRTVKALGETQEWSFGFSVLDAEAGEFDGKAVRFLKRGEIFEASPVLVGANRQTYTQEIKAAKYGGMMGGSSEAEGSYEDLSHQLEEAFTAAAVPASTYGYAYIVATYADHFVACLRLQDAESAYWDVPYVISADGTITLGTATEVDAETTFVPVKGLTTDYGLHAARIEHDVQAFVARTQAGSALRRKAGRPISEARRVRMAAVRDGLHSHADEINAMLEETAPQEPAKAIDVGHELARLLAFDAGYVPAVGA